MPDADSRNEISSKIHSNYIFPIHCGIIDGTEFLRSLKMSEKSHFTTGQQMVNFLFFRHFQSFYFIMLPLE